ncbi:MAG TPA: transposase [Ignavibacteria bacterium]
MRSRFKIDNNINTYFITSTIQNWISVFKSEKYIYHLIETIKYNQQFKDLKIYAYVIMPNHFHMICSSQKLSNVMSSIKSYSARKIIHQLELDKEVRLLEQFEKSKLKHKTDRRYQIWHEGFHP